MAFAGFYHVWSFLVAPFRLVFSPIFSLLTPAVAAKSTIFLDTVDRDLLPDDAENDLDNFSNGGSPWNLKNTYPVSRTKRWYARKVVERKRTPIPSRLPARLSKHLGPEYRMDLRRSGQYRSLQVHLPLASQHLPNHVAEHATTEMESNPSQCHESKESLEASKATRCLGNIDVTCNSSQVAKKPPVAPVTPITDPLPNTSCHLCDMSRLYWLPFTEAKKWKSFEAFRLAAAAGCQGCDTIVDASRVWLTHVGSALTPDMQPSLGTCDVCLGAYDSRREFLDGPIVVAPKINLRLQISGREAKPGEMQDGAQLYVFRPEGSMTPSSDIASRLNFACRPLPSGDTASPQAFACLKDWLEICTYCHADCNSITDRVSSPKRVLEITHEKVFLREDTSSATRYACLSHCWGIDGVPLQLKETNIEGCKFGISLSELPQTFRDAVEVCLRLGIAFLWIDALCIIQDNLGDWETEAAAMADVYTNAFLTIAATASTDSSGGCFSDPNSPFRARKLDRSILHVAKMPVSDERIQLGDIRNNPGDWPLLDRAWVYQERSLSRRIVHYTDTQLLWECRSVFKSESGDIDEDWSPNGIDRIPSKPRPRVTPFKSPLPRNRDAWPNIVQDYSRLKLTFTKDRLPALAAIVKSIKFNRSNDTYISGLWKDSLLKDLMWQVLFDRQGHMSTCDVPTWSWASVTAPVFYADEDSLTPLLVDINVTYTPIGPPQLGKIIDAFISLRSRSCAGSIYRDEENDRLRIRFDEAHLPCSGSIEPIDIFLDYDLTAYPQLVGKVDGIVVIFTQLQLLQRKNHIPGPRGIVLRKVSQDNYERIGMCETLYIRANRFVRRRAALRDNFIWRCERHFLASLPIQTFRIV